MKFDMHCHTKEGSMDGKVMIEEYIKKLKEKGFGGMLVSDHNSYDGYREWRDSIKGKNHTDFVVLKGVEYDTIDCGHMLVIMPEGVKLKLLELRGLPAQILIMVVHKYGGIVGPAHPYGEKYLSLIKTQARRKFHEERLKSLMEQFDFVEVFNACESEEVNEKEIRKIRQREDSSFPRIIFQGLRWVVRSRSRVFLSRSPAMAPPASAGISIQMARNKPYPIRT